jgi:hypothetical protein
VEEEHLAEALGASRARIAELEAALAAAQAQREEEEADGDEDDGEDDGDVGFILLGPESGGRPASGATVVPTDAGAEQRRQLEKKQMMDALSDFLNK